MAQMKRSSLVALSVVGLFLWRSAVSLVLTSHFAKGFLFPLTFSIQPSSRSKSPKGSLVGVAQPSFFLSSKRALSSFASPFDEDQYVYIPQSELEEAIQQEKKRHESECESLQQVIEEQRQELLQLKISERKERLKHKMYHDACWAENLQMLWSENQNEKMQRFHGRLEYLTDENLLLQAQLEDERVRHANEIQLLQQQLQDEKQKTEESKDVLGLERAFYETSVRLLEMGLEREGTKVRALQNKLKLQKSVADPLPQRNLHHQHRQYDTQPEHQQHHEEPGQHYRGYQPHENQYFAQFHQQQSSARQFQPQPRHQQQQHQESEQQETQHFQYRSDQFGFQHAHYSDLREQQQHPHVQQQRTRRYQSPSMEAETQYYRRYQSQANPPYSTSTSSFSVEGGNRGHYHHYSQTATHPSRQQHQSHRQYNHRRTSIPTMNGSHLGDGGINDIRNRLY